MSTNLALVGSGHIHTPGFIERINNRDDVNVKYVWDHNSERAKIRAEALNAQVADLDTIWADNSIPAVIVCSETNRHEPLVLAGAEAKKHLFVEKPLGIGADDANRMASAIEKAGVIFQTGYFMRGNPVYQFIKGQVEAGAFGTISRVRMSNCHSGALGGWFDTDWRWMADLEQAGCGGFGDLGTHVLDIMLWILGNVSRVTASLDTLTRRYGDIDEFGEGLLKFSNGVVGTLAAGWVDVANPVSLILSGTEGHAHVLNGKLYFQSKHVEGADGKEPWTTLPDAWPHAFDLYLDAVRGKKDVSLVSASEAAYRSVVMEAFYQGASRSVWVNL